MSPREDGYCAHTGNRRREATVEGENGSDQGNDADARTDIALIPSRRD